jgi:cell division protease FtsH
LLHGPPGTGKTYFAKIIATITHSAFLYASAAQFDEILVGRGAQRIRNLFDDAKSRAQGSGSGGMFSRLWNKVTGKKESETKSQTVILFIDEIDAIGSRKDPLGMKDTQTVSQLLTCMDGLLENHNVLVLAATNNLNHVDPALLRSGRFDRIVNVRLSTIAVLVLSEFQP